MRSRELRQGRANGIHGAVARWSLGTAGLVLPWHVPCPCPMSQLATLALCVPIPHPGSLSLSSVLSHPNPNPSCIPCPMSLPYVPALCPGPMFLPRVPALQMLCLKLVSAEQRGGKGPSSMLRAGQCRAVPCCFMPCRSVSTQVFQGNGCTLGGASGGDKPRASALKEPGAN